jgi:hypothetical protein
VVTGSGVVQDSEKTTLTIIVHLSRVARVTSTLNKIGSGFKVFDR